MSEAFNTLILGRCSGKQLDASYVAADAEWQERFDMCETRDLVLPKVPQSWLVAYSACVSPFQALERAMRCPRRENGVFWAAIFSLESMLLTVVP